MLDTADPFTVAEVVPEDHPRPVQHAARIGSGVFCSVVHDRPMAQFRWRLGVDGVNCPRCAGRIRVIMERE